jgi:hypothetical protein
VPKQPRKVHWDHLLDEADWLRRDFREERVWKMGEAKKRAVECVQVWRWRVEERGRFVEEGGTAELGLGYRRAGGDNGEVGWAGALAVRTRPSSDQDTGGEVLGKRKWRVASDGEVDVQDRLKKPKTLRRFSCHVDYSI